VGSTAQRTGLVVAQLDAIEGGLAGIAIARRLRVVAWVRRHPLVVCLPVQAVLLFTDLGRLPMWGDEQSSLARALGAAPTDTVHPSLYFLLLHGWLSALCGGPCIVGARALSALFVLAATVAIDRCWLRALDQRSRTWFLILWALSPALLLYGRMARSYSLQVLLACLALYAGGRYARRAALPSLLTYVAATTALLHTHYLPGIAVVAGISTAMGWRAVVRRQPVALWPVVVSLVVIGLAFAPWLPRFTGAVERVAQHGGYHVVGRVVDAALALAFTVVSFSVGESLWPWMVVALLALAPALAVVLLRGVRAAPVWLAFVAPAALVGFIGAYQWVSYAFVAPRLLFLLPFYLLLLVHGARRLAGFGTAVCTGVALLSLGGIAAYFEQTGFLNKAYVLPTETIANAIRASSDDGSVTVILDHYSSDLSAVAALLPRQARVHYIADPSSAAQAIGLSSEPGLRQVWFVHSAHDVSPQHWNGLVSDAFARRFSVRRTEFVPYSALDRWLMHLAGWRHRPHYAIELMDMRYAGEGG
jgi:hypothetical protein